jgi:hypothetical protein
MKRFKPYGTPLGLAGALCALLTPGRGEAQITVTPDVTLGNGLYHYDYTVANNGTTDLLDVAIDVAAMPDAIQNLMAPDGFQTSFDSGLGIVDFLADSHTFTAGGSLSGFAFDSPFGPTDSTFTTLDVNGDTFTGATAAPTGVPEPGGVALLGAAATTGIVALRRRRAARRETC